MTDALKPCAFCGSDDVSVGGMRDGAYVACGQCGAEGPFADFTETEAVAAWNRRHVAVTDEMVELAYSAYLVASGTRKDAIRAALTAALSGDADD